MKGTEMCFKAWNAYLLQMDITSSIWTISIKLYFKRICCLHCRIKLNKKINGIYEGDKEKLICWIASWLAIVQKEEYIPFALFLLQRFKLHHYRGYSKLVWNYTTMHNRNSEVHHDRLAASLILTKIIGSLLLLHRIKRGLEKIKGNWLYHPSSQH